jgi:hypothetical protein
MATLLGGRGERAGEVIMTEASGGDGRAEMERRIVERSLQDGAFRQRLLDDPRAAVEREPGATAARRGAHSGPGEDTVYLVLPSTAEGAE